MLISFLLINEKRNYTKNIGRWQNWTGSRESDRLFSRNPSVGVDYEQKNYFKQT
jgi:hypothetical protein